MFSKELFGQRLCEIRKKNHETQTDLGNVLGLAKGRVSDMENGKNTTTIENVVKICEHYKISSDYLLGITDDPTWRGPRDEP